MSKDNTTEKDKRPIVPAVRTKAFTFIEVIIALTIVSISMLALLRLNLISIRMFETAEITSQAVLLANEKIAEILAAGYPKEESNSGMVENNGLTLNWQTQVTNTGLPAIRWAGLPQLNQVDIAGLRSVFVDVSWKQGTGNKHLQMSTYVADRKLYEQ